MKSLRFLLISLFGLAARSRPTSSSAPAPPSLSVDSPTAAVAATPSSEVATVLVGAGMVSWVGEPCALMVRENSEALADDHRTGRNEPQWYHASVLLHPIETVSDLHAPFPCSVSPGSDVTLYVE